MSRDTSPAAQGYATIGDVAPIDFNGATPTFTISCWGQFDAVTQNPAVLVDKYNMDGTFAPGQTQYMMYLGANKLQFLNCQSDGNGDTVIGATALITAKWYCLQGRRNGSVANGLQVWVNGVLDAQMTCTRVMPNTATPLRIAANQYNVAGYKPDGRLCEVGIWDVALTDDELRALASGISPLMIRLSRLVGYWPLYGVGSPEPDVSPNRNHATLGGTFAAWPAHAPVARMAA